MKYLKPRNIVNSTTIVQKAIIAGGAAGNHNVAAIKAADKLICVWKQDGTSGLLTDLSTEFTVFSDGKIDNTGGTATGGGGNKLIVEWQTSTV